MFAWIAVGTWVVFAMPLVFAVLHKRAQVPLPAAFLVMLAPVAAFLVLGPLLGWIGLLAAQRKWAWWLLVVVYGAWALVLVPRVAGNVALWGWSGVLLSLLFGLPLLVLLTDRPRGWRERAAAKGGRDSGHETARQPRSSTKRPPTLVELLIIVAMLAIFAAIIGPALYHARRAGHGEGPQRQVYPAVGRSAVPGVPH